MVTILTCKCGHAFRSSGGDASRQNQCPRCGKPVSITGGYRPRMYLYQRAYVDYVGYLRIFGRRLYHLPETVWKWFWTGRAARIMELLVCIGAVAAGIIVGVVYVGYEAKHGRAFGVSTVIGSGLVALYVGMIVLSWKRPVHVVARIVSGAAAAGSILVLSTTMLTVAVAMFAVYLLILVALTAGSMVVFVPMRLAHYIYLLRRRITYPCPYDDCPTYGRKLPIHICDCGHEYRDLRPSFYGIFHHTCRHDDGDHKLPTLDILGRNKLDRKCSGCGRPLLHSSMGEARPLTLLVVGAPGVGKTVLIAQAIRQLCGAVARIPGARVRIDSPDQNMTLVRQCDLLDKGAPLGKTTGTVMEALGVAIKTPQGKKVLVQVFDAPGEHYEEFAQFAQKRVMQRVDGIMLLLDAPDRPNPAVSDGIAPADCAHQAVVGNLMQLLASAGVGTNGRAGVRVAVVLTKADRLSDETTARLVGRSGQIEITLPSADLMHGQCRTALLTLGYGNVVRGLEKACPNLRYFACTALARNVGPAQKTPVKAVGVVRPFSYLLDLPALLGRPQEG